MVDTRVPRRPDPDARGRGGWLLGIAAYAAWGVVPAFWKLLDGLPVLDLTAHRTVWACACFWLAAALTGCLRATLATFRSPRQLAILATSASLLTINWLVFIYAVDSEQLLHASLGYFINPLFSVLLGRTILGERLSRTQIAAVAVAAVGVVVFSLRAEGLPWIALVLASTFGLYGLARKAMRADAVIGSAVEGTLMLPIALAYLGWRATQGAAVWGTSGTHVVLLLATGAITAVPLLWFALAARRLPLGALGFLQYLAPTGQFLLAVLAYHEPYDGRTLLGFSLIWAALGLYLWDSSRRSRAWRA